MANNYGSGNQGYQNGGYPNPQQQGYNANPQQQGYGMGSQQQGYQNQGQRGYGANPGQQGYQNAGQQGYQNMGRQGYNTNPRQQGYQNQGQQGYGMGSQQQMYQNMGQRGSVSNYPVMQQGGMGAQAAGKPKKKANVKLIIIIAVVVVIAIAAIAVVVLFAMGVIDFSSTATANTYIIGAVTENGTAYIPLMNGESLKIKEETIGALMTPDREHVVVYLGDGRLYATDGDLENEDTISENSSGLNCVYDEGILYYETSADDEGNIHRTLYRYTFEDEKSLKLSDDVRSIVTADNSLAALYTTGSGEIYTIRYDWDDPEKIGSFDSSALLVTISDDASIAVWQEWDDDGYRIMLNDDGDDKKIASYDDYEYRNVYATFSADQNMLVIVDTSSGDIFIKEPGEDDIGRVSLRGYISSYSIYTNAGELSQCNAQQINSLYLLAYSNSSENLYYIDVSDKTEAEKEKVLSGVDSFYIADRYIVYLNDSNSLYYATLNGDEINDENRISSDVYSLEINDSSKYVYYFKNHTSFSIVADLYVYDLSKGEPSNIDSDVYISNVSFDTTGEYIYYLTEIETVDSNLNIIGELNVYSASKGEKDRISTDVYSCYPLVDSGLESGRVKSNSLIYKKYISENSDSKVLFDWYYYNGSEADRFASELCE